MQNRRRWLHPRNIVLGILGVFVLIQLVPVWLWQTNPPVQSEPVWASDNVRAIVQRSCYDCHSNQTVWPWYSKVAPMSWLVTNHVREGREKLNFTEWNQGGDGDADEIAEVIQNGEMPEASYLWIHTDARLTDEEKQALIQAFPGEPGGESEEDK